MGTCGGRETKESQYRYRNNPSVISQPSKYSDPMSEQDDAKIKLARLSLFIDAYNREVERLNRNMKECDRRAIECKMNGERDLALFHLSKRMLIEKSAKNYSSKTLMLTSRKQRIEQLAYDQDFGRTLKETNDLLKNHLNERVIDELRRTNEISEEIDERDAMIAAQRQSPEIEEEYAKLGRPSSQTDILKSMCPSVKSSMVQIVDYAWQRYRVKRNKCFKS